MNTEDYERSMELQETQSEVRKVSPETQSKIMAQIITELRLNRGYTQQEISNTIGIARQTYAGYERGYHEPSIEMLIRLAEIYGVSLDYIAGRYERTRVGNIIGNCVSEMEDEKEIASETKLLRMAEDAERKKRGKYNRAKKRTT